MNRILSGFLWSAWLLLAAMIPPAAAAQVEDPAGLENLRQRAQTGNAEAMLELGILYEFGFRMPDHKAPALAWYRLASEAGSAKAAARIDALRPGMSAAEIEQAGRLYAEYRADMRQPALPATTPEPTAPAAPSDAPVEVLPGPSQ